MTDDCRIAHIGAPLERQGGPAGYLFQLYQAAREAGQLDAITLPPLAPKRVKRQPRFGEELWARAGRLKRSLVGVPAQRRPSHDELAADRGLIEAHVQAARASMMADAAQSLAAADAAGADVWFCHDPVAAAHVLDRRRPGQQVWLMVHNPMPLALYLAWNWGVPESEWFEVMAFADAHRWTTWEVDVWRAVDRLILPCPEAFDEVVRIVPTAESVSTPISWLLSGASADASTSARDRAASGRAWTLPADTPVALYLGNQLPYRGFDLLMRAAVSLDSSKPAGIVAVAGPPRELVPRHARLRALGHVSDVAGLLAAVDCVVNVNRFSLLDLSTIEALEAGKPLLLHAVGGNKTFAQLGAGADMLPDLDVATIAGGLGRVFAMSPSDRRDRAAMSRRCYESHLTRAHLWARHQELYQSARLTPSRYGDPIAARPA